MNTHAAFPVTRLGEIMHPEPDRPQEAWGVLNPGGVRAPDGTMHLFPRIIAEGARLSIAYFYNPRLDFGRPEYGYEALDVVLRSHPHVAQRYFADLIA